MTLLEKPKTTGVVEQDLALKVYIDSLLFEDMQPEQMPAEETTEVVPETEVVEASAVVEEIPEVALETPAPEIVVPAAEPVAVPPVEVVTEAIKPEVAAVDHVEAEPALPKAEISLVPSWAEGQFEALRLQVAGFLNLAVPLVELNGIVSWSDDITLVPGHAEWFLGLLATRGCQVKVIDIAKFVIPQNHKARTSLENRPAFRHIILINGGEWGLACDKLGDVLKLSGDKVKWRSAVSATRPWLAGTIIDEMCPLLDISHFVKSLKEGYSLDDIQK